MNDPIPDRACSRRFSKDFLTNRLKSKTCYKMSLGKPSSTKQQLRESLPPEVGNISSGFSKNIFNGFQKFHEGLLSAISPGNLLFINMSGNFFKKIFRVRSKNVFISYAAVVSGEEVVSEVRIDSDTSEDDVIEVLEEVNE